MNFLSQQSPWRTLFLLFFINISLANQLRSQCDREQDSLSLVALYNSAGGPNWDIPWELAEPIDTWEGISIENDCVVVINLASNSQGNGLTGTLPELNLPKLRALSLAQDDIGGQLPNFSSNPELESLSISFCKFSGSIPTFDDNPLLEQITLFNNEHSGQLPSLENNLLLREINFAQNRTLTGDIPMHYTELENLRLLNLGLNDITGIVYPEFGNLSNLVYLDLGQNRKITGEIPKELSECKNLETLIIRTNNLQGVIPPEIGLLPELRHLAFSENLNLMGGIPIELGQLSNLEILRLNSTSLGGGIPDELYNCTKLKELWLSGSQLTGTVKGLIGNLQQLQDLKLSRNQLSGNLPVELGEIPTLTEVYLSSNKFTGCIPEGYESFCQLGFSAAFNVVGYNFTDNPCLPWLGVLEPFCNGESQLGAPTDDGDDTNGTEDVIDANCDCGPGLPKLDSDNDGVDDEVDMDDDNDGILDFDEGFCYRTPILLATQCAFAFGAGAEGIPELEVEIPEGSGDTRLVFVSIGTERDHGATPLGDNWESQVPLTGDFDNDSPSVKLDEVELTILSAYNTFYGTSSQPQDADHSMTLYNYFSYLAPDMVGVQTLDLSGFSLPKDIGDEMIVTISFYEGVRNIEFVDNNSFFGDTDLTNQVESRTTVPTSTDASDNLLLSVGLTSSDAGISGNLLQVNNCSVLNPNGNFDLNVASGESDGVSMLTQSLSGVDGLADISYTINDTDVLFSIVTDFRLVGCAPIDTDNDGMPDYLDLDSDNDGCADAIEGGGMFTENDLETDRLTGGVDPLTGIPLIANNGQEIGLSRESNLQASACNLVELCDNGIDDDGDGLIDCDDPDLSTFLCCQIDTCNIAYDRDGDLIGDACDEDDDNDGILDSVECPPTSLSTANLDSWVAITGGDVEDVREGDVFVGPNHYTDINGKIYDLRFELIEKYSSDGNPDFEAKVVFNNSLNPGICLARAIPAQNDHFVYNLSWVESGTVTAANLGGVKAEFDWTRITISDIDNNSPFTIDMQGDTIYLDPDYTDVGGFDSTIYDFEIGSRLTSYVLPTGQEIFGLSDVVTEQSNCSGCFISGELLPFTNVNLIHGVAGNRTSRVGRLANWQFLIGDCRDSDNDGQPDYLDLDSDNDGCFDAIEGSGNFTYNDITNGTLSGDVDLDTGLPLIAGAGQFIGTSIDPQNQDPDCDQEEICDNGIDDDGDGFIDCDDPDLADDCCCYNPPGLTINGLTEFCQGGSTVLTASDGYESYNWNMGQFTTQSITVTEPGSYRLVAQADCGTTSIAPDIVVTEVPTAAVSISGSGSFCVGGSTTLDAGSYVAYAWSTGETSQTITTATPGNFSVTVTDDNGCTALDEVVVTEETGLNPVIAGNLEFCTGGTATLEGGTGFTTYDWGGGNTTATLVVSAAGTYALTVTDASGCTGSSAVSVSETTVVDEISDIVICQGDSYLWPANGLNYTDAGTYSLETMTPEGCTQKNILNLEVIMTTNETRDITICEGESYIVDGQSYTQSGNYVITQGTGTDCESTINLNLSLLPSSSTQLDFVICEGESVDLAGVNYNMTGQYSALFTDVAGCDSLVNLNLKVEESVQLTESYNLDAGGSVVVNGQSYTIPGQYTQTLSGAVCDTTLIINISQTVALLYYNFDACSANIDVDNFEYTEFVPAVTGLDCGTVQGSHVFREMPLVNIHSCTPGMNNSLSMCISSEESCDYVSNSDKAARILINVNPDPGASIVLSQLSFFHKSPVMFDWINGESNLNNYPRLFGVRILVNENEVYLQTGLSTHQDWREEVIDLPGELVISEPSEVMVELTGYCLIGNGQPVSAWDLEDLRVQGSCDLSMSRIIGGAIMTRESKVVEDVAVIRYDNHSEVTAELDAEGHYAFGQSYIGNNYQVKAHKNSDHMNGVSTMDLVMMQRHILGIELLEHPAMMVAADINDDDRINGKDLVELKKLILGIYDQFPQNTSYKFLDNDRLDLDISPWSIPEHKLVNDLSKHEMGEDFTAVKIGDVNESALYANQLKERGLLSAPLLYKQSITESGSTYEFFLNEAASIVGLQLALELGTDLISIDSEVLDLNGSNHNHSDGILYLSWHNDRLTAISAETAIFTLSLGSELLDDLSIDKNRIMSEIYFDQEEIRELELLPLAASAQNLVQYDIAPNPFSDKVNIQLVLESAAEVKLEIFSSLGERIYLQQSWFPRGANSVILEGQEFSSEGVYNLVVSSGTERSSKLLIYTN